MRLQKLAQAPDWVIKWFAEIDSKRFGPDFDACIAPDAGMVFGVGRIKGFDVIKAHLIEFNSTMDTNHATPHRTVIPIFVHVWHMSADDPGKIQRIHGAVGPME